MKPIHDLNPDLIRIVFTDIDGTLTQNGQLPAESYEAIWKLQKAGRIVIPITGRPAGWCDLIARFWPVEAVIGENGALAYRMKNKKMERKSFVTRENRAKSRNQLRNIAREVFKKFPRAKLAADQFSRQIDLAIDFAEDVNPPLSLEAAQDIAKIFTAHGATAKISDIHVNGWYGEHDKLTACQWLAKEWLNMDLKKDNEHCVFIGDSQNDEPMYKFFKNSVAVKNIQKFLPTLEFKPKYVTPSHEAKGFSELCQQLLK